MFNLTSGDKKIIASRLYDKKIYIQETQLDNYMISLDDFETRNAMYDYIVNDCIWTIKGGAY